jgi:hypothetical protein
MKVRTTLTSSQLEKVAKGLTKVAEKRSKPYKAGNPAEAKMMSDMDDLFDEFLGDITQDFKDLL